MVTKEKKALSEWDRVLAEQANSPEQFATVAPPSYMKEGELINRPTDNDPAPMRVSSLRFNGYVEVWDTVTGVKSLQPWWLLWQTMKKQRPDGSKVFTRTDPKIPPNHGADLFCYLNPASPESQRVKGMGFKPCTKQHIPHEDALMRHVKKSHSRAWEALERERTERIRQEDRQLQKDMLAAMTQNAVAGVAVAPKVAQLHSDACPKCHKEFTKSSVDRLASALRLHNLKCKAVTNA